MAGARIGWAQVGLASDPPLLLLNGTGSPMAEWDPKLLGALAGHGHRVVVFDYPGLGASGANPLPVTFTNLADQTAGLVQELHLGPVDVLGWSMGGMIAQRLALRHPGLVRALVLAATNPGGQATVLGPLWVQQADSDSDSTLAAYVRTNYPAGERARGWAFIRRLERARASGAYPAARVCEPTYAAMVQAEEPWLASDGNLRALAHLRAPTLVITGAQDQVTPPANSRLIAATIPGARLVLIPRAGHSFLFQEPVSAARIIDTFLTG